MSTRQIITSKVKYLRKPAQSVSDLEFAASNVVDDIIENGVMLKRRRIVLNMHGCSVATCTMCPLPDESVPDSVEVKKEHIIAQLNNALKDLKEDVLTVYNNGNFFADKEILPSIRAHLYDIVEKSTVKTLVVESLPQFINDTNIVAFKNRCSKRLVVATGLQSWDDEVREVAINSTCRKSHFIRVVDMLKEYGYGVQAFVMFKPPFLSVEESINDVIRTTTALDLLEVDSIVISPMRITAGTIVYDLYNSGEYYPVSPWSLQTLVETLHDTCDCSRVRVATSILTGADGIDAIRVATTPQLLDGINEFNFEKKIDKLLKISHEPLNTDMMALPGTITERVERYAAKNTN